MSSIFDSEVYARRQQTPWARISLPALMKELATEVRIDQEPTDVTLTLRLRPDVASRFWWTLKWTYGDGQKGCAEAQELDLCLWRAAQRLIDHDERVKRERERAEQGVVK